MTWRRRPCRTIGPQVLSLVMSVIGCPLSMSSRVDKFFTMMHELFQIRMAVTTKGLRDIDHLRFEASTIAISAGDRVTGDQDVCETPTR